MLPAYLLRRAAACCAVAVGAALAAAPAHTQVAASGVASLAAAPAAAPRCVIPPEFTRFDLPLYRTARRLASGLPITIVAVGSSSTSGAGASSDQATYPSRLAADLTRGLPGHAVTVLNRGVSGDTATDMLARFEKGVIAEKPDVVLWQVGTNSLLRGDPVQPHRSLLHGGIERLKATGADIILIDPQFAPRVLARRNAGAMVALMEQTARFETVNLFRRFALMRHWHQVQGLPFASFLSPDELHMNDFSYACVARGLAGAITEAATRPIATASVPKSRP
jgi:lysophospholipase L1-like esterase